VPCLNKAQAQTKLFIKTLLNLEVLLPVTQKISLEASPFQDLGPHLEVLWEGKRLEVWSLSVNQTESDQTSHGNLAQGHQSGPQNTHFGGLHIPYLAPKKAATELLLE
jgi:hypothetical protein